jgi:hypothetical protein
MPDLPFLSKCGDCGYIGKSLFLDEPCPNCGRCSVPLLVQVRHGNVISTVRLNEACNDQLNKKYELAFNKAFELTQLIEQAIQDQFQNTDVFPTQWKNIQRIAHQKSQGYFVQEKDSEEAIKVAKDALELYVNENNKCCSKNKNG